MRAADNVGTSRCDLGTVTIRTEQCSQFTIFIRTVNLLILKQLYTEHIVTLNVSRMEVGAE